MKRALLSLPVALLIASCQGTTGGDLFEMEAFAAGPDEIEPGQPYTFVSDRGYSVELTVATLQIGALYLNKSVTTSVASETSCYLSGLYVAEVTEGLLVDLLDPSPQPFPGLGVATNDRARTAEVWLTGGPIEADRDPTVIAHLEGSATKDGETFPFRASMTISENRALPPTDEAQPGSRPLCKQRIVTPIAVDLAPTDGGALVLRIDPAGFFANVDFSQLEQVSDAPPLYEFRDDSSDQPSRNLFNGIRANSGVYRFAWLP